MIRNDYVRFILLKFIFAFYSDFPEWTKDDINMREKTIKESNEVKVFVEGVSNYPDQQRYRNKNNHCCKNNEVNPQ